MTTDQFQALPYTLVLKQPRVRRAAERRDQPHRGLDAFTFAGVAGERITLQATWRGGGTVCMEMALPPIESTSVPTGSLGSSLMNAK